MGSRNPTIPRSTPGTAPTLCRSRGAIHDRSDFSENHIGQNWYSDNAADAMDSSPQWCVLSNARWRACNRGDRETQALRINADLKLWMVEGANVFCAAS